MAGFERRISTCAALLLSFASGAPAAHFHHLHLNSTDPAAAIDFYARRFDCEKSRYADRDAVKAQQSWLLFDAVASPPKSELNSAIWHFGWGAEDMKSTYEKQLALGTKFATPISDISRLTGTPGFYYAYVDGPDHALIELNTANHHHFGHLHLFSDDPLAAAEWYVRNLGAVRRNNRTPSREPRFYDGVQVGPADSVMMDDVNIIIFPAEYLGKDRKPFESTKGHVVDHVGFTVEDLPAALKRLRAAGVAILETDKRSAFIEGPDKIRIELLQDPLTAGSNHAGKAVPEYVHGDECLFCHRNDIGPAWQKNSHGLALRQREDAPELAKANAEAEYFLGSRHYTRALKKAGYGKFAILSDGRWDNTKFADRCAGCHTTGVDAAAKTFTGVGLDCYTCHGDVSLEHTKDTSQIWLSKKRRDDALAVTSICAQCHLRGAASRSTGLPYASNFVAGDNLFVDFTGEFKNADDALLNPGDRHVWRNVRDVVEGASETTCLSCHAVHANSSAKHRRVLSTQICLDCHNASGPKKAVKTYKVSSVLCEYGG